MPKRRVIVTKPAELVTERQWQTQVEELLKLHGWKYYHTRDSRHSVAGFPDIIAVRKGDYRLLALELKSEDGEATPEQDEWLDLLEQAGAEAHVVYPSGLRMLVELLT